MSHTAKLVEQLELAAQFLGEGTAIKARLALILSDNAVELLLHDRCDYLLASEARSMWPPEANRVAKETADKVLGDRFDPKVSFLAKRKEISEDEKVFSFYAHRFGTRHTTWVCFVKTSITI